jgi:hypothetical protein
MFWFCFEDLFAFGLLPVHTGLVGLTTLFCFYFFFYSGAEQFYSYSPTDVFNPEN